MIFLDTSADLVNTTGTSKTIAYTNAGNMLFVGVFSVGDTITGVTYNGVAMTKVGASVTVPANSVAIALYYLANPAAGNHNIVISSSASVVLGGSAVSYKNTTGAIDISGTTTGTGITSLSKSLTTTLPDDWTLAYVCTDGFNVSAGANTTLRQAGDSANRGLLDSNGAINPAGSTTLNANFNGSGNAAMIMVGFSAASGISPSSSVSLSPSSSASSSVSPSVSRSPSASPSSSPSPSISVDETLLVDLFQIRFMNDFHAKYAVLGNAYQDTYTVQNNLYKDKYTKYVSKKGKQ